MAEIYPNYPLRYHPANFNAPFQNVYSNMKNLTLALLLNKDVRVIQRNLVYVIGLPYELINMENKLKAYEYFGQYGKIVKLLVNKNKTYNTNNRNGPSYSCYITYSKEEESSLAILSLDSYIIHNHELKANYGTTKFCHNFLENFECKNKDCLFLHKLADENDIIKRGDLISNKVIFTQQHSYAIKIADIYNPEVKKKILSPKKGKTIFPSPDIIYRTIAVMDKEKKLNNSKGKKNSENKNEMINKGKITSPMKENKINKEVKEKVNQNKNKKDEEIIYDEGEEEEEDEEYENEEDKSNNSNEDKNKKHNNINLTNKNDNINQQINKSKKLFLNREKSRFDFCSKNNVEKNNIIFPEYIFNIVNKKINSYNLTKFMKPKIIDQFFLDESIKNNKEIINDEWTKFINDNIDTYNYNNIYHNDEFTDDIDNINNFIFKKTHQKFD